MKLPVLTNLKKPAYLFTFLGAALIFFDLQYYIMASLPGSRNEACVMGINLTPLNIVFSIITSTVFALMITGFIALLVQNAAKKKVGVTSLSGAGFGLGALTVFCPVCSLPAFSFFGLSLGLEIFNSVNIPLKILSVALMIISLHLLNRQLNEECDRCVYESAQ